MPHPIQRFMKGSLPLTQIYDQLVRDFAADGHPGAGPDTTFYDDPPAGMGYQSAFAAQVFLNGYVNSQGGKRKYNLAPEVNIFVTQVGTPKCVGNLAAQIFAKQQ
jgi:hypothetical protein